MAITYRTATGLTAASDTAAAYASLTYTLPTGHTTGDLLLCYMALKPYDTVPGTPSGYTALSGGANGTTAMGSGTGSVYAIAFYKEHDGSESGPSSAFSAQYSPAMRGMIALESDVGTGGGWTIDSTNGSDTSDTGTGFSATGGATLALEAGDHIFVIAAGRDDSATPSSVAITVSGCTLDTVVVDSTLATSTGNDGWMYVAHAEVLSGTASGAPVTTATVGSGDSAGQAVFILIREPDSGTTPVEADRDTTWDVLATVTATRATTWFTDGTTPPAVYSDITGGITNVNMPLGPQFGPSTTPVSASRSTTWDVLAAVSQTRATTWDALARVTAATRATTWDTVAQVTAATRATTWDALARVTPTRATSWDVLARVTPTRATTWDVLSAATATRATTWNVASALTPVSASRATTWNVIGRITATRATTWDALARVTPTRATTWDVLARVTPARSSTWNVRSAVTPASRATTWRVLGTASGSRATTWNLGGSVATSRATTWDVLSSVVPAERASTWNVLFTIPPIPIGSMRSTFWNVNRPAYRLIQQTGDEVWTLQLPTARYGIPRASTLLFKDGAVTFKQSPLDVELRAADWYVIGGHDDLLTEAQAADLTTAGYGSLLETV